MLFCRYLDVKDHNFDVKRHHFDVSLLLGTTVVTLKYFVNFNIFYQRHQFIGNQIDVSP